MLTFDNIAVLAKKRKKNQQNIIVIIIIMKFFPSALADGLSLEFEWQKFSSSLQDSSQYSDRSQ